jgi:DNA-binding response OmpR family regulator
MRVLVVEDEAKMAVLLRRALAEESHLVEVAGDGETAVAMARASDYDAIVMDVMLPGMDGFSACRRIRDACVWTPLLLLTARDAVVDRVAGLDSGADDYLTKPFANAELLARVEALLRRASDSTSWTNQLYDDGVLHLDPTQRRVFVNSTEVRLTPTEFRLLNALVRHAGAVLSANQLLTQAWDDPTGIGQERVKFAVLRLRRKLG